MNINIHEADSQEVQRVLAALHKPDLEEVPCAGGVIKGFVDVLCREEESGEIAWEIHQPNLFTDYGRGVWGYDGIATGRIFTSGVAETPRADRPILLDWTQSGQVMSANVAPVTDWGVRSKTWSTTFGVPGANRAIGTVGLCYGAILDVGVHAIVAYSLLVPAKVQSTTQTLEISYRLTMTPSV